MAARSITPVAGQLPGTNSADRTLRSSGLPQASSQGGSSLPQLDLIQGLGRSWGGRPFQGGRRSMGGSEMRQQTDQSHRARRPQFDLVASKLHRPLMRPGTVHRSSLIERLTRGDLCPIVSVVAPAGYGKTTLLSQWAERNGQA